MTFNRLALVALALALPLAACADDTPDAVDTDVIIEDNGAVDGAAGAMDAAADGAMDAADAAADAAGSAADAAGDAASSAASSADAAAADAADDMMADTTGM